MSFLYSSLTKSVALNKEVQIPLKIMTGQGSHCRDAQRWQIALPQENLAHQDLC